MADHRFHVVVDLVGNEPTEIDALLMKGREHNFTGSGKGFVRNSRDYEWGYTLHKDAVRASRRLWKLFCIHNEKHAAVYIRHNGALEVIWSDEVSNAPAMIPAPQGLSWLKRLAIALVSFRKTTQNAAIR